MHTQAHTRAHTPPIHFLHQPTSSTNPLPLSTHFLCQPTSSVNLLPVQYRLACLFICRLYQDCSVPCHTPPPTHTHTHTPIPPPPNQHYPTGKTKLLLLPLLLCLVQDNTELVTRSLPELTQLLSDSDPGVLAQAAQVAQQLTKKDASRHAIVNNPSVVSALVHAMASTNDAEVQRSSAGALHSISTDK